MDDKMGTIEAESSDYTGLTADLVVAYVANNPVPVTELAALIANVHAAVTGLGNTSALAAPRVEKPTAAQIRKSIRPDALISFEDGKPYKTLRRHLTGLGLDPETYREKWGLPRDYPFGGGELLPGPLGDGQEHRPGAVAWEGSFAARRHSRSHGGEVETRGPAAEGQGDRRGLAVPRAGLLRRKDLGTDLRALCAETG
ncbi:putative transcriptional regulator [Methylobacterium radiotolerans]